MRLIDKLEIKYLTIKPYITKLIFALKEIAAILVSIYVIYLAGTLVL